MKRSEGIDFFHEHIGVCGQRRHGVHPPCGSQRWSTGARLGSKCLHWRDHLTTSTSLWSLHLSSFPLLLTLSLPLPLFLLAVLVTTTKLYSQPFKVS